MKLLKNQMIFLISPKNLKSFNGLNALFIVINLYHFMQHFR